MRRSDALSFHARPQSEQIVGDACSHELPATKSCVDDPIEVAASVPPTRGAEVSRSELVRRRTSGLHIRTRIDVERGRCACRCECPGGPLVSSPIGARLSRGAGPVVPEAGTRGLAW